MTIEGKSCLRCDEPILNTDRYEATILITASGSEERWLHQECAMRSVIGGAVHVEMRCSCFVEGGPDDSDPPGLTKRQAALAAAEAWKRTRSN